MDYRKLTTKTAYLFIQTFVTSKMNGVREGNRHVVSIPAGVDLHYWLWNHAKQNPHLGLDKDIIRQLDNKQEASKMLGASFIFEYRILENEVNSPYEKVPDHIKQKKRRVNFKI